jgi:hypothetical protein
MASSGHFYQPIIIRPSYPSSSGVAEGTSGSSSDCYWGIPFALMTKTATVVIAFAREIVIVLG